MRKFAVRTVSPYFHVFFVLFSHAENSSYSPGEFKLECKAKRA